MYRHAYADSQFNLTRAQMPQIEAGMTLSELRGSTDPEHQQKAEAIAATGGSPHRTVMDMFLDSIQSMGYTSSTEMCPVGFMRPTQNEIDESKVLSMAGAYQAGETNLTDNPIIVSQDDYILDGHHRWAALYALDTSIQMPVLRINMPMSELLTHAHATPGVYRVDVNGMPVNKTAQRIYKVASRSILSNREIQADVAKLDHTAVARFLHELQAIKNVSPEPETYEPRERYERIMSGATYNERKWPAFLQAGREIADWILETREIPKGSAKDTELACRLFKATMRAPRDVYAWWQKNKQRVYLLIEAQKWPERSSAEAVFSHGPFTIHNTLQMPQDKLGPTLAAVDRAVALLHQTSPKLAAVCYGDMFLAGQILKSGTLAWYQTDRDIMFLRPQLKIGNGDLHSILHELGHRYMFQKMGQTDIQHWRNYHLTGQWAHPPEGSVKLPAAGEVLTIPIKGQKELVTVTEVTRDPRSGRGILRLSSGGAVYTEDIYKLLRQQAVVKLSFPSQYASTHYEENYAETFAFFVMEPNKLTETMIENFKQVSGLS